jgi:hypothetical protein
MNKIIITLACLLTGFTASSQERMDSISHGFRIPTGIGHLMVGSNILLANITMQKGVKNSYNIGLDPKNGVFILNNIALGASLNLGIEVHQGYQSVNYGISPFARVYFGRESASDKGRRILPFVEAGVGYGGANSKYTDDNGNTVKVTTNGPRVYVMPGLDFFLNRHVALEAALEYLFIGGKPDVHVVGLNLGFQIFLSGR